MDYRIDLAKLSGFACAPLHGRACALANAANAGTSTLTLPATAWNWQAGDYVILIADDLTFDVQPVINVAGLVLTLAGNYQDWFMLAQSRIAAHGPGAVAAVMGANAVRIYRPRQR